MVERIGNHRGMCTAARPSNRQRAGEIAGGENAVQALVNMGFDRDAAMRALVLGDNDLSAATNLLLGGMRD
jgi:uncharacterized UBP type Zn finger protein